MKKYTIATAIVLTASIAVAGATVNLKKVNKIVKSVIQSELTPLINKMEVKFDERSNLENVENFKAGVLLSASARESKWSKSPTSLDLKAQVKTLNYDPAHTKGEIAATISSKTEAVPLYAYAAKVMIKELEQNQEEIPLPMDESDKALLVLLKKAEQTTRLDQIPAQLEELIVFIKNEINQGSQKDGWDDLMNSLKVDTKTLNNKTTEVTLKTTVVVAIYEMVISDLSLKITEKGLSFGGTLAGTVPTEQVTEILGSVKGYLSMIENADAETLANLKEMAKSYVQMAEYYINGDEE